MNLYPHTYITLDAPDDHLLELDPTAPQDTSSVYSTGPQLRTYFGLQFHTEECRL